MIAAPIGRVQLLVWALVALLAFVAGWVSADARDWWRRRRGTGKAKKQAEPTEPFRPAPRHIRRQRGRAIASRVSRAMAESGPAQ